MKKVLCLLIAVLTVLSFCACAKEEPNEDTFKREDQTEEIEETVGQTESETESETEQETEATETDVAEHEKLALPKEPTEFYFSSGAGAWGTSLTLNSDGTFTGGYHDSEMGDTGNGYPYGTVYVCGFSGKFENVKKLNDYSYRMELTELKTERKEGEEWIEDSVRYVASGPYGIETGTEFVLYLPETPISVVSQDFLSWWPYRYESSNLRSTLSCYGIQNVSTQYGFFTWE